MLKFTNGGFMMNSRRQFFKYAAGLAGLAATLRWMPQALAAAKLKMLEVGKGMALALNYNEDKKKVTKSLQIEKDKVKWDAQFCSNCSLYTKTGMEGGKEVGLCSIFPNEHVLSKSWCVSWSKKA